jgi:hypothetical protein
VIVDILEKAKRPMTISEFIDAGIADGASSSSSSAWPNLAQFI